MNNSYMKEVDVTASYAKLVADKTVLSCTISTPPGNAANVTFKDAAGREVPWTAGEWHDFKNIDLSEIQIKGTVGDTVTVVGGTW